MQQKNLFNHILFNNLVVGIAGNFLWFALVFWAYLETKSVLITSVVGGIYLVANLISGIFFGAIVDHNKKKNVMAVSSAISLVCFAMVGIIFASFPESVFTSLKSVQLWGLIFFILVGVVVGNLRMISLSTLVTLLFSEEDRPKANGKVGVVNGIGFALVSVFSGLVIGQLGMGWAIAITIAIMAVGLAHILTLTFPAEKISEHHDDEKPKKVDIRGTISIVAKIHGLMGLIFFSMFNNFLGGVFMSLMDAYGLSLVSVETWGFIWGFLSLGFIVGGWLVATRGLGKNPVRTLLIVNIVSWTVCIFFTSYSSIILTSVGMFIWMCTGPFAEACEQTIFQKVVPYERQGRVFGFAQSVEQCASPLTAFLVGPLAEFFVIPFMASATGVSIFGGWFGTSSDRAIALIFTIAGLIGLTVTLLAFTSKSYRMLSKSYLTQ